MLKKKKKILNVNTEFILGFVFVRLLTVLPHLISMKFVNCDRITLHIGWSLLLTCDGIIRLRLFCDIFNWIKVFIYFFFNFTRRWLSTKLAETFLPHHQDEFKNLTIRGFKQAKSPMEVWACRLWLLWLGRNNGFFFFFSFLKSKTYL